MKIKNIKRTFIVDDDPFWTTMLTQMLSDLGYSNVVNFENGQNCIDNLHFNPNLVFLDYEMDIINGIEVLKKIKEYYPGIGVVFCTAHEDLSVAVDAMQNGSFDYLLKSNATKKEVARIIGKMNEKQIFADKVY
ncbi:MAG: response regulator [Sphingobacteriia bacterium]|jgi:DNA-binding NtrC family response regulator